MGENGGTFELQRLQGAGRGGKEAVRVVQGAVLQAPQPTPTLNQSAAAATAAATAAAILSMALAANMKYHTAKPFSMNIKFRLTISISCTNVSVTKFALGLGQRGQDSGTGRRPDRQTTGTVRETERQSGVKEARNQFNCQIMPMQKAAQYFAVPIFVATIVSLLAWSCTFVDSDWTNRSSGPCFWGHLLHSASSLTATATWLLSFQFALLSSFLTVSCGLN